MRQSLQKAIGRGPVARVVGLRQLGRQLFRPGDAQFFSQRRPERYSRGDPRCTSQRFSSRLRASAPANPGQWCSKAMDDLGSALPPPDRIHREAVRASELSPSWQIPAERFQSFLSIVRIDAGAFKKRQEFEVIDGAASFHAELDFFKAIERLLQGVAHPAEVARHRVDFGKWAGASRPLRLGGCKSS